MPPTKLQHGLRKYGSTVTVGPRAFAPAAAASGLEHPPCPACRPSDAAPPAPTPIAAINSDEEEDAGDGDDADLGPDW